MLKLLVAVDGSEHAEQAVLAAARLARETAVEALVVNVRGSPVSYGDLPPLDGESIDIDLRARQDTLLEAVIAHARQAGLSNVRSVAARGAPAAEIVRVAADEGVDQIVMGTRGRSALGGLLLGSVAQRVVHLATVPVLLVK